MGILNKSSQKYQALSVLHEMEALFSEFGRWLNDIAWQIFLVADQGGLQLETAEDYARKAVLAMEEEGSAMLDLSYDTLAQILLKQDKTEQACICFQKAAEAAPKRERIITKTKRPAARPDEFDLWMNLTRPWLPLTRKTLAWPFRNCQENKKTT